MFKPPLKGILHVLVHWVVGSGREDCEMYFVECKIENFSLSIALTLHAFHFTLLYCMQVYILDMSPNFKISSLYIMKKLPMYDKSRLSKLTYFTCFALKFIERLSSEKDFCRCNYKITLE